VEMKAVPAIAAVDGRVMDMHDLAGQHSLVDLVAGEQLLPSQFRGAEDDGHEDVEIPDGFVEITVLLDSHRALGGALRPGDTVSTFLSFVPKKDDQPNLTHLTSSQVLVTQVVGAGTATAEADKEEESAATPQPVSSEPTADEPVAAPGVPLYVTFAARAAEAETIVFAAEHGTVWLARDSADVDLDGTRVVVPMNVYAIDPATIGATP
jgi:pilus assembly protein CpaB